MHHGLIALMINCGLTSWKKARSSRRVDGFSTNISKSITKSMHILGAIFVGRGGKAVMGVGWAEMRRDGSLAFV